MTEETPLGAALAALLGTDRGALADAGRALRADIGNLNAMVKGKRHTPAGLLAEVEGVRTRVEALDLTDKLDAFAAQAEAAGLSPAWVRALVIAWARRHGDDAAGERPAAEGVGSAGDGEGRIDVRRA